MFPVSKLRRLSKDDKKKSPSFWIKSVSSSVQTLNISNLLTGSDEGVNNLPSLLFGRNIKVCKSVVDKLFGEVRKIPKKCMYGDDIRGPQLNMGFTNFAGKNRCTLMDKEMKLALFSNTSGLDVNIPSLLKCHENKHVSLVYYLLLPIISMMDNCFKKSLPEMHNVQMKATHDNFKLNKTCFNKVMLKITPESADRGCKIHYDKYNYGYCAILILFPSCTDKIKGGEQVIICSDNVYRMKCVHGDLFFGKYQNLLHCVTKCRRGHRGAIIAYTSNKIANYCRMKDVYDNLWPSK